MAIEIVQAPPSAERTTVPLSAVAVDAMHRLEPKLADRVVANFDNHGSLWGFDTVEDAERAIDWERVTGADINEWETVDRDGQPLRVVRIADPEFLDTIAVFSAWDVR